MSDTIQIDFDSLQKAVKKLILPEETIDRILAETAALTARWARNKMSRELGKARIDLETRKGRLRLRIDRDGQGGAEVWFGLDGVSLAKFHPVQTPTGVHTDVMDVPGAFLGDGRKSLGKKSWNSRMKNISGSDMSGAVFKRRGAGRLPIDKQFYDMARVGDPIFDRTVSEVLEVLSKNFEKAYLKILNT